MEIWKYFQLADKYGLTTVAYQYLQRYGNTTEAWENLVKDFNLWQVWADNSLTTIAFL